MELNQHHQDEHSWDPRQPLGRWEPAQGLSYTCRLAALTWRREVGEAATQGDKGKEQVKSLFWLPSSHVERMTRSVSVLHTRRYVDRHPSGRANKGRLGNEPALSTRPSHCTTCSSLVVERIFNFVVLCEIRCFSNHVKNGIKSRGLFSSFLKY